MKNEMSIQTLAIFSLAVVLFAPAVLATPKLQLASYSLSQSEVHPGDTVYATLTIQDIESDCAKHVAVQLSASYPLFVPGIDSQYNDTLCEANNATFVFPIVIDPLATDGTYQIAISTTYMQSFLKLSESNTIGIRVVGQPNAILSVVSSNPIDLYPGDTATVLLSIVNNGSAPISSGTLTIDSNALNVKWAGETGQIAQIPARSAASYSFTVEVPKNMAAGSYPVTAAFDYLSNEKKPYSVTQSFQVPVKPKAEFIATSNISVIVGESSDGYVMLKNTGSQEADKLKVAIKPVYPFGTDGTIRFVDRLKPGETVTLEYSINVDKEATLGSQIVGVYLDYQDPQGKTFSDTADLSMTVRGRTTTETIYSFWYVGVAILLVLIMMARNMLKKKQ